MASTRRSVPLAVAAVIAILAVTGVGQSAYASPAPEVGAAGSTGELGTSISGDETGGELTITPITREQFEDSKGSSSCVTQEDITLCQSALFDDGDDDRYERVGYSATAYVGQAPAVYAEADVTLNEGYVLGSTGGAATNTSPYVRIDWKGSPDPLLPYDGPDIDIPAEASGLEFQMIVSRPGDYSIGGFCSSDPEQDHAYTLHCGLHPTGVPSAVRGDR